MINKSILVSIILVLMIVVFPFWIGKNNHNHNKVTPEQLTNLIENNQTEIVADVLQPPPKLSKHILDDGATYMHLVRSLEMVRILLNAGTPLDQPDNFGATPLYYLLNRGESDNLYYTATQLDIIRFLIEHGANVNVELKPGISDGNRILLHNVISYVPIPILKRILSNNADVNKIDELTGNTLLHLAIERPEVISILLKNGADVRTINPITNQSALSCAITNFQRDAAQILYTAGATPKDDNLFEQVWFGHINALRKVTQKQLLMYSFDTHEGTLLHAAAANDQYTIADILIRNGLHVVDTRLDNGATPLHIASANGCLNMVKWLIMHGAIVDSRNQLGETPLLLAVKAGEEKVVSELIRHGANVNVATNNGSTPLHYTTTADIAYSLLTAGAKISVPDGRGNTPLHYLVSLNNCFSNYSAENVSICKIFLDAGASVTVKNKDNEIPLQLLLKRAAIRITGQRPKYTEFYENNDNNMLDAVKMLLDSEVNINVKNNHGETLLILAVQACDADIVRYLLSKGVDKTIHDVNNKTAIQYANPMIAHQFQN